MTSAMVVDGNEEHDAGASGSLHEGNENGDSGTVSLPSFIQLIWQETVIPEDLFKSQGVSVNDVNRILDPYRFRIIKYLNNYVLVNTWKDEISINFSSKYDDLHRSVFLHVMKLLAEDGEHKIAIRDAAHSSKNEIKTLPKTTTISQIRDCIECFIADEWLHVSNDDADVIVFSPRSLVELKEYFSQDLVRAGAGTGDDEDDMVENDMALQTCTICQNVTAHDGLSCQGCGDRVHKYCVGKMKRCISCNEEFVIANDMIKDEDD